MDSLIEDIFTKKDFDKEFVEKTKNDLKFNEIKDLESRIPIGRVATTTEQSMPVLFLCSSAASYITGTAIDVNGGQL